MKRFFLHTLYKLYRLQWVITRPIIIGVRVMLIRDGQILLIKHSYQDGWLIPGGGVKRRETIEQAARRECREEVGAEVGKMELVGIFTNFFEHKNDHIVVFISHEFTIHPKKDFEIEQVKFFDLDALPDDMMEGSQKRIEEYLQGNSGLKSGLW